MFGQRGVVHGGAQRGDALQIAVHIHAEVQRRQKCGHAVAQMMLRGDEGILRKEAAVAGVGVDIDETGADVQPLRVDDLAALRRFVAAHLAKVGDAPVLDQQHGLGDQVVAHHQFRVDDRFSAHGVSLSFLCSSSLSNISPSAEIVSATPAA